MVSVGGRGWELRRPASARQLFSQDVLSAPAQVSFSVAELPSLQGQGTPKGG